MEITCPNCNSKIVIVDERKEKDTFEPSKDFCPKTTTREHYWDEDWQKHARRCSACGLVDNDNYTWPRG